jgi:hypothetical protein
VRNTQLDSSMPRRRPPRGVTIGAGDAPVPFNYRPPILASLGGALVLVLFLGILAFVTINITLDIASGQGGEFAGPFFSVGLCGFASLVLCIGILYFLNAIRLAVLDLASTPVTYEGRIVQRMGGRGRGGAFWIVVGPPRTEESEDLPSLSAAPDFQPPVASAEAATTATATGARDRGFVSSGGGSFGAQLRGTTVRSAPAESAGAWRMPETRHKLAAGEVNLRVDKHIFEALVNGDRVQVVYSPHLQHVYYVRKRDPGGALVLRNLSLL